MATKRRRSAPRVVVQIDMDCFYASVVIRTRPHLVDKPVGVLQKTAIVTTNYVAREMGIPKMGRAHDTKRKFPQIHLIDGSDLTPFRAASREVMTSVRTFLTDRLRAHGKSNLMIPCERLGLDEIFIELTDLVALEYESNNIKNHNFCGNVIGESKDDDVHQSLKVASSLVQSLRDHLTNETKLPMCAGISCNKLLSKIACNAHKPNQQTTLFPEAGPEYLSELPLRKVPGIGYALKRKLDQWCESNSHEMKTVRHLLSFCESHRTELENVCGGSFNRIMQICVGICHGEVKNSGPPKTMSSEDSTISCSDIPTLRLSLGSLSKKLLSRCVDDFQYYGYRQPKSFHVRYRIRSPAKLVGTRSTPLPSNLYTRQAVQGNLKAATALRAFFVQTSLSLLSTHTNVSVDKQFTIGLVGMAVTNFSDSDSTSSVQRFLRPCSAENAFKSLPFLPDQTSVFKKYHNSEKSKSEQTSIPNLRNKLYLQTVANVKSNSSGFNKRGLAVTVGNLEQTDTNPVLSCKESLCPICNQTLPVSNALQNIHIDACISNRAKTKSTATDGNVQTFARTARGGGVFGRNTQDDETFESNTWDKGVFGRKAQNASCPICGLPLPLSNLARNEHIDKCLSPEDGCKGLNRIQRK